MTTLDQPHELTWGALVLDSQVESDVPWVCETLAEGASFGNPVPLVEEVRSLLTDGSLAVVSGWDNREVSFRLRLSAPDGQALAQAEAAFMAEVLADQPSPLTWTPPMLEAWPAVLDVVHVRFDRDYADGWDFDERFRQHRYYTLTLTCLPWARDPETTIIPALPAPEVPTEPALYIPIDTCDSTTGWSMTTEPSAAYWTSVTLSPFPGYLRGGAMALGGSAAPLALGMLRTGAVDMDGMPYLTVDVDVSYAGSTSLDRVTVVFDTAPTTAVAPVAAMVVPGAGPTMRRLYFEAPASFGSLRVRNHITRTPTSQEAVIRVHEVGRIDRIEIDGSNGLQVARMASWGGSAPAQATLRLTAPDPETDPVLARTALIYTGCSEVVSLRGALVSGPAPEVDDTMISGASNDMSTGMTFHVPVSSLSEATYGLLARLKFTGSVTVAWAAQIMASSGAAIPGSEVIVSGETLCTAPSGAYYRIHELAAIQMPVVAIEGDPTHVVALSLSVTSGGANVDFDEAWLCDTDSGAVTVVDMGFVAGADELAAVELRSPEIDSPRPAVVGTWVESGVQDISRLVTSWGTHLVRPGLLHIFTATDGARYAECELEGYQRYHTHPGPPLAQETL